MTDISLIIQSVRAQPVRIEHLHIKKVLLRRQIEDGLRKVEIDILLRISVWFMGAGMIQKMNISIQ